MPFFAIITLLKFDKNANSVYVIMVTPISRKVSLATIGVCDFCAVTSVAAFFYLEKKIMPVIKCPNCGCEIFDETKKEINHLNSQSSTKITKVKIPPFFTGISCDKLCEVEIRIGANLVWQGLSGSIAFFRLDNPQKVSIFIKEVYTHHPFLFFKNFIIKGNLQPDKNYEIKAQSVLQKNDDPTKLKYFFAEI